MTGPKHGKHRLLLFEGLVVRSVCCKKSQVVRVSLSYVIYIVLVLVLLYNVCFPKLQRTVLSKI